MDVDFVRVNDAKVARAYDIETFPAVIFFRKKFPQYYVGDLMDEDAVSSARSFRVLLRRCSFTFR